MAALLQGARQRLILMKICDTCGGPLAVDHPFTLCPKCLFDGALRAHTVAPERRRMAFSNLSVRQNFFDKYEILEKVAEGGQGEVWKTWDFEFRRCVAMKRISADTAAKEPAVYRFLAEAQITSQLQHPGILPVFDMGLDPEGRPFYTTQLLSGATLEDVWKQIWQLKPSGEWTLNRALELLLRICEVMGHAHSSGVIHRDLKPANVLVGEFSDVRVIDWGSACVMESLRKNFEEPLVPFNSPVIETDRTEAIQANPQSSLATASSGQPLTMAFTAPELVAGNSGEVGPYTDIYSIGAMLYQLLTGKLPYSSHNGRLPNRNELKQLILDGPPVPVRSINSRVSRDLAAICHKAMCYNKSGRYALMRELASDIRAAIEIRPVRARKSTIWLRLQKWSRRNIFYVLLGSVSLTVICIILLVARGLMYQRDLARQVNALRDAEIASRNGHWHEALADWDLAEAGGYKDKIYLDLQRAEAWTILSEPDRSGKLLKQLSERPDLGNRRGVVLLRLGEHELFDASTAYQGAQHVRQALAMNLEPADALFAKGLLADTTPDALNYFLQAIQLDPFHHGAHRHSLGLEFLLGRRAELEDNLRFFAVIYPNDPSATFLEAAESAMQGHLEEGRAELAPLRNSVGTGSWTELNNSLLLFATVAKNFDPDTFLNASNSSMPGLTLLRDTEQASQMAFGPTNTGVFPRMPFLPCIQDGPLAGRAALAMLMLPSIANIDVSVREIKSSWRHHPEALIPAFAGLYLNSRQSKQAPQSPHLLSLQADLFQLAADSPSIFANLDRTSRFLASRAEFELIQSNSTNSVALRRSCLGNIHRALAAPETSRAELQAYYDIAMKLGDLETAHELVTRWERQQPQDIEVLQARAKFELAAGNLEAAWNLAGRILAATPDDAQALAIQKAVKLKLSQLIELVHGTQAQTQPISPKD